MDMTNKNVRIVRGKFQGLEGVVVGDCKLANKWLIKLDEFNAIYADKDDVIEGNIISSIKLDGQDVRFKTDVDNEVIWVTIKDRQIAIKMFDVNKIETSLNICINDFKIKSFQNQIHILQLENMKMQGIEIK